MITKSNMHNLTIIYELKNDTLPYITYYGKIIIVLSD